MLKIKPFRMSQFKIVKLLLILLLVSPNLGFGQATYNNCDQALLLCPQNPQTITNIGATKSLCPFCEDDFTLCFTPNNSIWLKFETNTTGGDVTVNFTNVVFETGVNQGNQLQATIFHALAPCDGTTYSMVGSCEIGVIGNFSVNALGLLPLTTYYVVVNGAQNGGATMPAEATMDVSVSGNGFDRPTPSIAIGIPNDTLCPGETYIFYTTLTNCTDSSTYQWFINGALVAVTDSTFFETAAIKNGDVVSVSNTCFSQCQMEVIDSSIPLTVLDFAVNAGNDATIKQGQSIVLQGSTNADSYVWTPAFFLSSTLTLTPIASPEVTTNYYLVGTKNGCTLSDGVTIFVDNMLEITNTFTPNGDGFNDRWEIPSLESYPDCIVQIFDRWGQLIYQTTGYNSNKAWNGTHKGKEMEASVYFYVIEVRAPEFPKPIHGSLTLVR